MGPGRGRGEIEQGTEEKQRREVASSAPDYSRTGQLFGGWGMGFGKDWEVRSS